MNKAGITRRIDNLGRIVIPKEIRKNLRIKNGENFEILINENNNIILKKYNDLALLDTIAKDLGQTLYNVTKKNIFITNTEKIIYTNKKEQNNKEISREIIELIINRKEKTEEKIKITDNNENSFFISPILSNGDVSGSIIIEDKIISEIDKKLIILSTKFLSKYIED